MAGTLFNLEQGTLGDLDLHIICIDLIEHWLNYDLMKGFLIF